LVEEITRQEGLPPYDFCCRRLGGLDGNRASPDSSGRYPPSGGTGRLLGDDQIGEPTSWGGGTWSWSSGSRSRSVRSRRWFSPAALTCVS